MYRRFPALMLGAIAACTDPVGPATTLLRVEPEAAAYLPGADVYLRIANVSDHPLRYDPCTAQLQHLGPDGWVVAAQQPGSYPCPGVVSLELEVGATASLYAGPLPEQLPKGTYRFVVLYTTTPSSSTIPDQRRPSSPILVRSPDAIAP